MGYRIQYDSDHIQIKAVKDKKGNRIISLLLVCMLVIGFIKMIGWDRLKHYLLPGDPDATVTAFSSMVQSIKTGESVTDAVSAFCTEIIAHAK